MASGLEVLQEGQEHKVLCWARWRQLHHSQERGLSSRRDREDVASNAAAERAAFANSRGAAYGHYAYYEGGECCQGEHIGGLGSGYFDGIGTSFSSEEGTGSVEGKELMLSVTMNSLMDYFWRRPMQNRRHKLVFFLFCLCGPFCDSRVLSRQLGFVAFSWTCGTSVKLFMHSSVYKSNFLSSRTPL